MNDTPHGGDVDPSVDFADVASAVRDLARHVRTAQMEQELLQMQVAVAAGVPASTLTRLYQGNGLHSQSVLRLLDWLVASTEERPA